MEKVIICKLNSWLSRMVNIQVSKSHFLVIINRNLDMVFFELTQSYFKARNFESYHNVMPARKNTMSFL